MNTIFLLAFCSAVTVLLVFLVGKNTKEKDKFENQLNDDYHRLKSESVDDELL